MMTIRAILPPMGRDYRLDLLRGFANWAIYLDHIPNNVVNWLTQRNYGFSDAADLFVFISGYTASLVFARMMLERGFVIGGTRLIRRAWQIYVAHIVLFVMYIAEIGYLAHRYGDPNLENEFNVAGFMANPAQTLYQGLILAFKPVNMDVLPLYILLMVAFPPVLWAMLRLPNLTLAASFLLYSGRTALRLESGRLPDGSLVFQPVLLAVPFHIRRLVCARRLDRGEAIDPVARVAVVWQRLLALCARHDDGGTISADRSPDAGMAL